MWDTLDLGCCQLLVSLPKSWHCGAWQWVFVEDADGFLAPGGLVFLWIWFLGRALKPRELGKQVYLTSVRFTSFLVTSSQVLGALQMAPEIRRQLGPSDAVSVHMPHAPGVRAELEKHAAHWFSSTVIFRAILGMLKFTRLVMWFSELWQVRMHAGARAHTHTHTHTHTESCSHTVKIWSGFFTHSTVPVPLWSNSHPLHPAPGNHWVFFPLSLEFCIFWNVLEAFRI